MTYLFLPDAAIALNLAKVECVNFLNGTATIVYQDGCRVVTSRRDLDALVSALVASADNESRLGLHAWLATSEEAKRG